MTRKEFGMMTWGDLLEFLNLGKVDSWDWETASKIIEKYILEHGESLPTCGPTSKEFADDVYKTIKKINPELFI